MVPGRNFGVRKFELSRLANDRMSGFPALQITAHGQLSTLPNA
jgi:hypothetical protein